MHNHLSERKSERERDAEREREREREIEREREQNSTRILPCPFLIGQTKIFYDDEASLSLTFSSH